MVEDDFFQWVKRPEVEESLTPVWEYMLNKILTYDLSLLDQDVLKGIYQELVDPFDRHDLGEYYTPEWLCGVIVDKLLPSEGYVSVLDPTCDSGSFLRAAIDHMLRANPTGSITRLRNILDNVMGIDIHPHREINLSACSKGSGAHGKTAPPYTRVPCPLTFLAHRGVAD